MSWRAPELGSLLQHLELSMTYYFRGAFLGKVIIFAVGIIKARFYKALLAQLKDEIDREGAVCLQSRWDVASLTRLIFTLCLRDKDAKFRNIYINRLLGTIGDIYHLHVSGSKNRMECGSAEVPGLKARAAADPTSSLQ